MGPDEPIKAAPEVRNIVALIVGGIPLAEIVKSVVVPPFAVLGTKSARIAGFLDANRNGE